MYLAPLNYDRYFKKVFSDVRIAKRFLEDFFEVSIEEIEMMTTQHKITDDAMAVEFDFRCKINGQYLIIDMQQWYKPDIVHRFYTYHCINTALQLESIPAKSIALSYEKEKKIKDYSEILPVITLVWMVHDSLGFHEDYIAYTMTPELALDFIRNNLLWQNKDIASIMEAREKALLQLSNKTKQLDFLQKNRLIYMFQKNIVANSKSPTSKYHKYLDWFELAEKTQNKLNQKADFLKYEEDSIFVELMRRISKEMLTPEDFSYIEDQEQYTERVKRYDKTIFKEGLEVGLEKGIELGIEQGIELGIEKGLEQGIEKGIELQARTTAQKMIAKGMDNGTIAEITGLSEIEIQKIREEIK